MAEKENKDTKKETTIKKTSAAKKETTKREPVKKQETKKEEKEVKTPKTTKKATSTKTVKEEVKEEQVKAETANVDVKEAKKVEAPKGKVTVETKKFEIKSNKNVSKKGNGKKVTGIIVVIAVIAIVALLTVLIVTSSDPKKSVDGYLTNLKAGDFEKAQEFTTGEKILTDTNYSEEVQKLLFDRLSWKVTKVTTENNIATVEIEITNKDFSEVTQNWTKRLLSNVRAVIGKTVDTSKYFEEELRNENLQTKTTTGTIKLENKDKKWKVIVDKEIENILLPGLENSINYLK